jgi:vacuolar protein sorting-associated protein 13A/C
MRCGLQRKKQSGVVEEEVFENERFMPIKGWGSRGNLLPAERKRYSTRDAAQSFNDFPSVPLPEGF